MTNEEAAKIIEDLSSGGVTATDYQDALRLAAAALRGEDTRRLDMAEELKTTYELEGDPRTKWYRVELDVECDTAPTLRAAIDAARGEG